MSAGRPPDPASLPHPWLDSYPPGVPPSYHLPRVAVPRLLDDAVRDFATRPAVVSDAGTLDHATLRDRVEDVRATLVAAGVAPGDRVLVALPNLASLPVVLLAVWRCAAVVVPVDPRVGAEQLDAIARDARIRAVVGPRRAVRSLGDDEMVALTVDDDAWLFPRRGHRLRRWPRRIAGPVVRRLRRRRPAHAAGDGPQRLEDAVAAAVGAGGSGRDADAPGGGGAVRAAAPDDLAVLAYGPAEPEPHGVELTHANLVAAAFAGRLWVPDVQAGKERVLVADPATGLAPMALGFATGLLAAASVVLLDDPDAAALVRAIERERPTLLLASPDRLAGIVDEGGAGTRDLGSVRVVLVVGGPLDRQLAVAVERRTGGARVRAGFGSPETGPLTHAQPVYGRAEWGAMGLPVTDVVAVVIDPDAPASVRGPNSVGRLLVRGPQTARGYWGRPEATARRFVDGWVLSDELVTMDADGIFRHLGTRDEVLVRPDGPVALRQVEAALERHPGVRRAAAVGSDDGQLLAAVVVRRRHRPDSDELLVHCREHLDAPAVPDSVTLVDELPETAAGALARDTLRERLAGAGGGAP